MVYSGLEAGRMQELKYNSCIANIVYLGIEAGNKYCLWYAGIETGKKECLCKGLRIV